MQLDEFLASWDAQYVQQLNTIPLFQPELTKQWTAAQKRYFAHIFYHCRGHFHDFLWNMGNHADDNETKDVVLKNIGEELNGSAKSHEELYLDFEKSVGTDVRDEFVHETSYLPFAREFNHGHLNWLHVNDTNERFSAFAAYERLDNVDYVYLLHLVESLDVPREGKIFFKVHTKVEHFATTETKLTHIWATNPEKVKKAFSFIAYHQLTMWRNLSDTIFAYEEVLEDAGAGETRKASAA